MHSQQILLEGHLLDSLTLPKVMDHIVARGGEWEILSAKFGKRRKDLSKVRLLVEAPSEDQLAEILVDLKKMGAVPVKASFGLKRLFKNLCQK